jgi:hypothetical protein
LLEPLLHFVRDQRGFADIFAFQEVFDGSVPISERGGVDKYSGTDLPIVPDLFRRCVEELQEFRGLLSDPYSSLGERLAMFVRRDFTIGESGQIELHSPLLQTVGGTDFRAQSIAQSVQLSRDGIRLRVINTHGLWIGGGKGDTPERIEQSERLGDFLSVQRGPIVLCGDFNLLPATKSIRILEKNLRNLISEFHIPTTRSPLTPESKGKFADYVFVSPGLRVTGFRTLDVLVSDHLPLLVEIEGAGAPIRTDPVPVATRP